MPIHHGHVATLDFATSNALRAVSASMRLVVKLIRAFSLVWLPSPGVR